MNQNELSTEKDGRSLDEPLAVPSHAVCRIPVDLAEQEPLHRCDAIALAPEDALSVRHKATISRSHLSRFDAARCIVLNQERDVIRRGPQFAGIEPLPTEPTEGRDGLSGERA